MTAQQANTGKGVARIWRGRTSRAKANEYTTYMYEHGIKKLESLGARGVQLLREDREQDSYFMVLSFWDTRDAMTRWAGDDPNKIRHLERDPEYLLEMPTSVQVLQVCSNNWFLNDTLRGA